MAEVVEGLDSMDPNMVEVLYELMDNDNYTVLITAVVVVSSFVIVSVVVILWRRIFPAKKKKQLLVVKQTEKKQNHHSYLVSVVTGSRRGSGTKDFVQITLTGKRGQSLTFTLNPFLHDPERKSLRRGSLYKCILLTPEDLGDLYLAEVDFQSSSGGRWFLSYIVVQDMQSYRQWYFPWHDWLYTLEGCEGSRVNLVPGVVSQLRLIGDNFLRGLRKHHIWRKLLSHLRQLNQYNSVLSLSYCTCLSLCLVFANALVYRSLAFSGDLEPAYAKSAALSLFSNVLVSIVTAFLEVGVVAIENRNRFEFIEESGTMRDDRAKGLKELSEKLEQLNSSLWSPDEEGGYEGFGYPGDECLEADLIVNNDKKEALKCPSPGVSLFTGPPLRSAMRSPLAQLSREIAVATDSTYCNLDQERKNLRKEIRFHTSPEVRLYSQEAPASPLPRQNLLQSYDSHGFDANLEGSEFVSSTPIGRRNRSPTKSSPRNSFSPRPNVFSPKKPFNPSPPKLSGSPVVVSYPIRSQYAAERSEERNKPVSTGSLTAGSTSSEDFITEHGSVFRPVVNYGSQNFEGNVGPVLNNEEKEYYSKGEASVEDMEVFQAMHGNVRDQIEKKTQQLEQQPKAFSVSSGFRQDLVIDGNRKNGVKYESEASESTGRAEVNNVNVNSLARKLSFEEDGLSFSDSLSEIGKLGQLAEEKPLETIEYPQNEIYEESWGTKKMETSTAKQARLMDSGIAERKIVQNYKERKNVEDLNDKEIVVNYAEGVSSKQENYAMPFEGMKSKKGRNNMEQACEREKTTEETLRSKQENYALPSEGSKSKKDRNNMEQACDREETADKLSGIVTGRIEEFLKSKAYTGSGDLDNNNLAESGLIVGETKITPPPVPNNSTESLQKRTKGRNSGETNKQQQVRRKLKVSAEVREQVSEVVSSLVEGFVKTVHHCIVCGEDMDQAALQDMERHLVSIVQNTKRSVTSEEENHRTSETDKSVKQEEKQQQTEDSCTATKCSGQDKFSFEMSSEDQRETSKTRASEASSSTDSQGNYCSSIIVNLDHPATEPKSQPNQQQTEQTSEFQTVPGSIVTQVINIIPEVLPPSPTAELNTTKTDFKVEKTTIVPATMDSILTEKVSSSEKVGFEARKHSSFQQIADIQDDLDLGPVSRKLSDVVVGKAYQKNMDWIEKRAEDILTANRASRERVFGELRRALSGEQQQSDVYTTAVNLQVQPPNSQEEQVRNQPSTSQNYREAATYLQNEAMAVKIKDELHEENFESMETSGNFPQQPLIQNIPTEEQHHTNLGEIPQEMVSKVKDENFPQTLIQNITETSGEFPQSPFIQNIPPTEEQHHHSNLGKIPQDLVSKVKDEHVVKVAEASLQSVLSREVMTQFQDTVREYGEAEVRGFAVDVVASLYKTAREKLKTLLRLELRIDELDNQGQAIELDRAVDEDRWGTFQSLLQAADSEVQTDVLPVITEHLVTMVVEEAVALETIDVDLMMLAFGGQFVETVVTNAVLQTHIGLVKGARVLLNGEKHRFEERSTGVKIENTKHSDRTTTRTTGTFVRQETDVGSLDMQQVLSRVLESLHEQLSHRSRASLQNLIGEEDPIHCGLCKPKAIRDISERLVRMSAAKYITGRVFSLALEELTWVQQQCDITVVRGDGIRGDDRRDVLVRRVGEALRRGYHGDEMLHGRCRDDLDVIEGIVGDLTEYIIEHSCSEVAQELIALMDLEHLNDSETDTERRRVEEISEVIERRVRDMLNVPGSQANEDTGSPGNSNCNAATDPLLNTNPPVSASGLSSELEEIRALVANEIQPQEDPIAPNLTTHTAMETDGSRYHLYRYDDHKKYRVVTQSWVFFLVFGAIVFLSLACFVSSILIGLRFDDTLATHWLTSFSIAMCQHVFVLETLKVFFLAIIASVCGGRLL